MNIRFNPIIGARQSVFIASRFAAALAFAISANRNAMRPANRRAPKGVCLPLLLLSFLLTQGRLSAQVTVTPAALDFGVVAAGQTKDLTLTCSVSSRVTVDAPTITGANASAFQIISQHFAVAPATSNVVIRFTQTAAAGGAAVLNIPFHYLTGPTHPLSTMIPLGAPLLSSLDFGAVPSGETKDLTYMGTLTSNPFQRIGDSVAVTGANAGDFQIVSQNFTGLVGAQAPAQSVYSVIVRFHPTAGGTRSATLALVSYITNISGSLASTETVPLTGTVTGALPTVTPNPADFGLTRLGQSKDLTLNVFLDAGVTDTYLAIDGGANPGDFQVVSQNCVGGTGNCSAVIRFTPTSGGTRSATLTLKGTVAGSAYTKTVPLTGSAALPSAGLAGAALQFDGATNSVTVPHNAALTAFPLTAEAWINTTQTVGVAALVSKYAANSFNGWQMFLNNGKLSAYYFGGRASNAVYDGGSGAFSSGVIADGNWHHVAFTVDVSGGKLYVDGALAASLAWTGTPTAATVMQPLTLGAASGAMINFAGQMDEVRIWNATRSPFDFAVDQHASLQGNEAGLLAYYRLDEGKGGATADATANHFDGTLSGAPVWLTSTAPVDTINIIAGQPHSFVLSGFDPAGLPLTYQVASSPAQGTLSGNAPDLTYTPGANFAGNDLLTYTVSAPDGGSAPATVKIVARGLLTPTAPLIAYEGFDYPAGASLAGQNGGFGFAAGGAWTGDASRTIVSASLAAGGLLTSGGSVLVNAQGASDRALASPLGANGTTAYFSFLIRPGGTLPSNYSVGLGILGGTNIFVGKPSVGATGQYVIEKFGGAGQAPSGVAVTLNETVLLVVRADFKAGNDTLRLYVNPTPGKAEPAVANATLSAFDLGTVTGLEVPTGTPVTVAMDEYRVGHSFADVTPRPAPVAVSGHVTLEGIVPTATAQTLRFAFGLPDSPDTVLSQSVGPDGAFSLQLPQGVGSLWIKGYKYLAARVGLDTTGGDVSGVTALLLAGDANNDNSVDVLDFGLFVSAYNSDSSVPGSGYGPNADFNGDGFVDATDFGLLVGNYGANGDQ